MNIVLVPGFLGFGRLVGVSYFQGVEHALRTAIPGVRVLATTTRPFGSIASRAGLLDQQLRNAFRTGVLDPGAATHLFGHSMGGLDVRYLTHMPPDPARQIRTVVTIGTPHLGTPLASLVTGGVFGLHIGSLLPNNIPVLDELRATTGAAADLTPQALRLFNQRFRDVPAVGYVNVVGTGRIARPPTSTLFWPSHLLLHDLGEPNDGVVPYPSAAAGGHQVIEWPGDHADLIGHDLDSPPGRSSSGFNHLQAYVDLAHMVLP
jgi:triacylglycerol lipase